ncbi:MAG: phosphate ABC transporter ATP-binding protein [Bacteroidales bacterium]|nr:phosphate ABC transporter ATP-binding protein [Bacteroidales bacterium]MBR3714246.1 phosphate ABC transporter ATP-binding protein [Bacteroidales bacterium]
MWFKNLFLRKFLASDCNEAFVPDAKFKHPDKAAEIKVEDFNLWFGDAHILKNINVAIPPNKITCIIGPSGCGKTTLLKSFNRLVDLSENVKMTGSIRLGDEDIVNCSASELVELRRKIGLVPQRPTPLPMSIMANVAYGCKIHGLRRIRENRRIVRHYLKVVGLWNEVKDRLRSPAVKLSIGQQQRLCLARSLAVEPEFILADEATSALDPVSSRTVEDLFVKLKEQYSIIMVTHTLRQAMRIADYVIFIYLGEIIEVGDAKEVFHNPKHELTKKYLEGAFS